VQLEFDAYLIAGTKLWSSSDTGTPPTYLNNMFFPGWNEGMQELSEGSRRKLIIPAPLAFGEQGRPDVPANALAVIDVEALGVDSFMFKPEELPGEPVEGEPVVTESGLKYYNLVVSEGDQPTGSEAEVKVHYSGYLNNGNLRGRAK